LNILNIPTFFSSLLSHQIPKQEISNKTLFLYTATAYFISVFVRLSLYFEAKNHQEFFYNDKIIPIWTADAGLYGSYAKQILNGAPLPFESEYILGHFIAFICTVFPLDIDLVMFFLPAALAPLMVVPVMLIANLYKLPQVGFFAAVLSASSFNYYYRTHLGYTDTDLLIFTLLFFVIYSMMNFLETKNYKQLLFVTFYSFLLLFWYHSAKPIVFGMLIYFAFLSIFFVDLKIKKYIFASLAIVAISCVFLGFSDELYLRAIQYFDKSQAITFQDASSNTISIENMLTKVNESGSITFQKALLHLSKNIYLFVICIAGIIILFAKQRAFLLFLPPLLVGILSIKLGVRFTTFAITPLMFGAVYLIFYFGTFLKSQKLQLIRYSFITSCLSALFVFSFIQVKSHNKFSAPFFAPSDVELLNKLEKRGENGEGDYIFSWWDIGWPLRYFTNFNTLIDNGKFDIDSFIVASAFFGSENYAANSAGYFLEKYNNMQKGSYVLLETAKNNDIKNLLLEFENNNINLPKRDFDIYFYMNEHMLNILPAILSFSKFQNSSQNYHIEKLQLSRPFEWKKRVLNTPIFTFDTKEGYLLDKDTKRTNVGNFFVIDEQNKITSKSYSNKKDRNFNILVYKNRFVLTFEDYYLNSFFIKAFLLGNFDKDLFELVEQNHNTKVFKLKKGCEDQF